MRMSYEAEPYVESKALGYSWPHPGLATGTIHGDPRIRVHPECLQRYDRPDVKIVSIPDAWTDRPVCHRCHHRLER